MGAGDRRRENLDRAQELIARRTQENKKPTEDEVARLTALASAADRAAEASKALDLAKAAVTEATESVFSNAQDTVSPTGRFDSAAALRQWNSQRVAIYAQAEDRIRDVQRERVEAGAETEQQAAENTARGIAAIDAAYALQSAAKIVAIKKKAAEDVANDEKQKEQALKGHLDAVANDFGDAMMKLASGGKVGNVGRDLIKQILNEMLEALVRDPLVKLIKDEMAALVSPSVAGGGGIEGFLGSGLRMLFGGGASPVALTNPVATGLSNAVPNISITPPGFASGTNSTPDGLHWVGEYGPELRWQGGMSIKSAAESADWITGLQDRAFRGGVAAGGSGDTHVHYSPVTNIDAKGADPAQLQRTQDAMSRWQRGEPARVGAYLKAAKLR